MILLLLKLVEAAGVEPASEKARREKATCVSGSVVSAADWRASKSRERPSPIDLSFRLRTEALGLSCKMTLTS